MGSKASKKAAKAISERLFNSFRPRMGGKPSKGTPADKRLTPNKPGAKKSAPTTTSTGGKKK
jgi:hypothetical protein